MNIILILQDIPLPSSDDTKDVRSLLTWIIGILLVVAGFVIRHYLLQNAKRDIDKDNQIIELQSQIKHWQNKYDEEIKYGKELGNSTARMVSDNTNVLRTLNKSVEVLNIDISGNVKPVVANNNSIVKDIKKHLIDNK